MTQGQQTAQAIVAMLQDAIDDSDLETLSGYFPADTVLIGTSAYNIGDEAIREYLSFFAEPNTSMLLNMSRYNVFLESVGLIGFSADGHIEWTGGEGPGREPFRLSVTAVNDGTGWSISHFHGSIPHS